MPQQSDEGGLRDHRIEFVRETVTAEGENETPADPTWLLYSDNVRTFEWTPDAGNEEQRGIGNAYPSNFNKAPEEHALTVEYDLQKWLATAGGDPLDAAYDGLVRDANNKLPNTHTVVDREDKAGVVAANLVDANPSVTTRDVRTYTVGLGGHIATPSLNGDPSDQQPVLVELGYEFEKIRTYQIDQPPSGGDTVTVSGLGAGTEVTIENEDQSESETLTSDGATTQSFTDVDAVYLNQRQAADVTLTYTTSGDEFMVIEGASSYDDVEGDLGVPTTGTGDHASAVGTAYETILGDTITRSAVALAYDVNSKAIEVDNNVTRTARDDTMRQRIHVGDADVTVTATVLGETESHAQLLDALTTTEGDLVWTMTGGTITVPGATMTDYPSRSVEQGQAEMSLDTGFTGQGLTVA